MLIDWFTVGAQALNFMVLVWLLKRFLYKPILSAIDAREQRIAAQIADADKIKTEAGKERDAFQGKNGEFDRERAALMAKALEEANAERGRLLEEARLAADAAALKRRESLASEARGLDQAILRRTHEEVFAMARKVLKDLADADLEDRLAAMFTRRLRDLESPAKAALAAALKTPPGPAVLRSAFAMSDGQRKAFQDTLKDTFASEIPLRFETEPELISGFELSANGQKAAWSMADYLGAMEKSLGQLSA